MVVPLEHEQLGVEPTERPRVLALGSLHEILDLSGGEHVAVPFSERRRVELVERLRP